ncbi:hypothetical protein [Bacillus sp. V5-8f]|uniref:hypothetical protein n=1 Tax=Bacillus sp. V5-8f TaxID=2053044 RepID=UPI000C79219E|nr:hypothetical protein [Bacillus sp. V5-8f]PLT32803.1 hypothetical protein CUU64_16775 [Bacillus sp. V5-8f]
MRKYRNHFFIFALFFLLVGCTQAPEENPVSAFDKAFPKSEEGTRNMSFDIVDAKYVPETNKIEVLLHTNLPKGTEVDVTLVPVPENENIIQDVAVLDNLISVTVDKDGKVMTEFVPDEDRLFPNGNYEIGLSVELSGSKNKAWGELLGSEYLSDLYLSGIEEDFGGAISINSYEESEQITLESKTFLVSNAHTKEQFLASLSKEKTIEEEEQRQEEQLEESEEEAVEQSQQQITEEKAKEIIANYSIGENDTFDNVAFENGEVKATIVLAPNELFPAEDLAVNSYSQLSDELLNYEGWQILTITYDGIGTISMHRNEKETNEFGDYFPTLEIENKLNL